MLSHLKWQPLAERRRHARLVMFYKIHYQLVSIRIPIPKLYPPVNIESDLRPIAVTNSLAKIAEKFCQSSF